MQLVHFAILTISTVSSFPHSRRFFNLQMAQLATASSFITRTTETVTPSRFETPRGVFEIQITKERSNVREFMFDQHVKVCSAFKPDAKDDAVKMFPIIFSELVEGDEGNKLWAKSIVWKCTPSDEPNKIVGAVGIYEEIRKEDGIPFIYVSFWFVDKEFTDLKIGKKLWEVMMTWLRSEILPKQEAPKYRTVSLITASDLYEKAYKFYLREGFREFQCEYKSPHYSLVRMEYQFS